MNKGFLYKVVKLFKPMIRAIADAADLKLSYPHTPLGNHALIFKDAPSVYIHNIPKSATFNTRSGKIVVGENTVFGEDVMILTGKHNYISEIDTLDDLQKVPESGRDIIIGKGCYLGSGVIVIGPVNIGDYAVIGAGSVVTKDLVERTLYGGVPAKKIKDLLPKYEK
jgi:acetyltransferase-like isoleucine patch superfamily enzyme